VSGRRDDHPATAHGVNVAGAVQHPVQGDLMIWSPAVTAKALGESGELRLDAAEASRDRDVGSPESWSASRLAKLTGSGQLSQ
jgi:hypothetical protein